MTRISIKQKEGIIFKLSVSGNEYFLGDSDTSVDVQIAPNTVIYVEETNQKEKLTLMRIVLFILSQIIMILARFVSLARPDWRDYVDPFILKSKIEISGDTNEVSLRYSPGGYSKKSNSFFMPEMTCNSGNVSIATEVEPDYSGLRDAFFGFMLNTSLFMVICISTIFVLLCLSYKNMNSGLLILISTVLVTMVIVFVSTIIYNRYKYMEIKENLKEFMQHNCVDN